ncbi:hypothetical protein [Allonocardiopsis opalescens]|uniref:mRNA interferase MazF n=1 Tax=Allonocardiopsis opalescens TaxID=1144618 RepID=A0A2T0PT15_9ACTN|nr:hypothetical protein [Allonocardiopsis opalescens]PRX92037.1 hypothetical protein CLV72_112110 [Allonocardiopsis opalescens]
MRKGEIWAVRSAIRTDRPYQPMLVLAADDVIRHTDPAPVSAAPIVEDTTQPQNLRLLGVPLQEPVKGVVRVIGITPVRRVRFEELLGRVSFAELEQVDAAIRAVYGLRV